MSFFEIPEPDAPRPWRPSWPWLGPSEHELGVHVPFRATIVSDTETWFGLLTVKAYSSGFSMRFRVLRRAGDFLVVYGDTMWMGSQVTDKVVRLGIEFGDGGRATNLEWFGKSSGWNEPPKSGVALTDLARGHGSQKAGEFEAWVWPAPPPGPLGLIVEWPAVELGQTRIELPTDSILEAAERSRPLWADDPQWEDDE